MSAAAAATPPVEAVVPVAARGKKKALIVIGVLVLLVLALAAGGAVLLLRSKAAHANAGADDEAATSHASTSAGARNDPAHPPTFLPLEPFVVNLADRDVDRYAQVGIVLEVDSALFADQMKAYMPAIRNAILLILAGKTSHDLLERSGKEQLAEEIRRETVRPMGIDIPAPEPIRKKKADAQDESDSAEAPAPKVKSNSSRGTAPHNPVRHVNFSNFIIQ
ncbi:MAG: flagellar basal body-associated FliL family protein [Caldimonas sp.]